MKTTALTFYRTGFYSLLLLCGILSALILRSNETSGGEIREIEQPRNAKNPSERPPQADLAPQFPPAERADQASQISVDQKLEALAQLTESNSFRVNLDALIGSQNKVRGNFIELFDLSASQTAVINQLLARTNAGLLEARAKHANATIEEDGSVRIDLEPFLESGRTTMDSFYAEMEQILGRSKLNVLERIVGDQINHHFNQFGAEVATYTVKAKFDDDGNKSYHYTRHVDLEGGHTSHSAPFANFESEGSAIDELNALLSPELKRHLESIAQ